jgi:hypothetical protein
MRWLCLSAVIAWGCGPSSYDDFRSQLANVSCDHDVRCGVVGASERASCKPPLMALTNTVPDAVVWATPDEVANVSAAIAAGRMRFVSSGAQDCLDALGNAPCDEYLYLFHLSQHCHDVVQPNLPLGGACFGDGECVGGVCVQASASGSGACVPYAAPGAACAANVPPSLTCDPTVQYCGLADSDAGVGGNQICLRHQQAGGPCTDQSQCAFGLFCINNRCGDFVWPREGDSPCGATGDLCTDSLYCNSSSTCVALGSVGDSCEAPAACRTGLACIGLLRTGASPTLGTCQPWLDLGSPCTPGPAGLVTGCPADQRCDPTSTTCVAN